MTDAAFWDRHAESYFKSKISNMPAYEETLERARQYLSPEDRAIEIGCGTGMTATKLAPYVKEYVGTDLSPGMIEQANGRLKETPVEGLRFEVATANEAPSEAGQYDVVLGFNLYHLVPDLDGALANARDLLKPGGLFISKTTCLKKQWYLRPLIKVMQAIGKAPYVGWFNIEEYDQMIEDAGFEIVETGCYPAKSNRRFVVARKPL